MLKIKPGQRYVFSYTNYRGVTETRCGLFVGISFGSNEWYPEPTWLMDYYDLDRNDWRSFALERIDTSTLTEA